MNDLLFSSLITPVQIMMTQYLNQGDFLHHFIYFLFFKYLFTYLFGCIGS